MEWLIKHWWILVLVFLVGVIINVIKDLNRVDHKKFLSRRPRRQRSCATPCRTAILTINGTMTTTGQSTTSRRNRKFAFIAVLPACNPVRRGYSISMISSPFGVLPLSASSK